MATINVEGVSREMNGKVEVRLDVRTSMGKISVPFKFDDQGSASANEKHAYGELRVWLQEAQQALEDIEGR
jgi:hypothetical protein